ncbi:hypothetical protein [Siphonobacter sp. SORGH_AS_1065]|uniref:hypothetical protein n=1 Tax=Siphonobacter sp. SORGH_AS_1065 TaxID=3041795 RepID=UPI0027888711|nr:hypothetical protein [Siphonobacter sp. SORGH_AS_1065]MDQ1089756.1 membrane protein YdbS with pleckstrin-like domain [Siphonobacter sp. SORGH_AS_1065]
MKSEIIAHLDDPNHLEKLYRTNKAGFKREFSLLYPELKGNLLADSWNARLHYQAEEINWGSSRELLGVILACLLASVFAKLPAIASIQEELYYSRNIGFIVFPLLTAYFAWKNQLPAIRIAIAIVLMMIALVYINLLPNNPQSDTLVLSCIHMVLFLWSILGFAFVGKNLNDAERRLSYLRYNGDLLVMTALILISGGIMTGITIGLFSLIKLDITSWYFNYVVVSGLASVTLVGTYLTQTNPQLVSKVSPVIAKIFSPLVLVMLVIYLGAILYTGKDPYNDREFLMVFNVLLVGVMAIIFFSIAETSQTSTSRIQLWVLFLLSVVTIVINGIALSAILFRISSWGITPNRLAILGGNILILVHLFLVTAQLVKVVLKRDRLESVGKVIAFYLPVYTAWTIIVTFLFPIFFGYK